MALCVYCCDVMRCDDDVDDDNGHVKDLRHCRGTDWSVDKVKLDVTCWQQGWLCNTASHDDNL